MPTASQNAGFPVPGHERNCKLLHVSVGLWETPGLQLACMTPQQAKAMPGASFRLCQRHALQKSGSQPQEEWPGHHGTHSLCHIWLHGYHRVTRPVFPVSSKSVLVRAVKATTPQRQPSLRCTGLGILGTHGLCPQSANRLAWLTWLGRRLLPVALSYSGYNAIAPSKQVCP